MSKFIEIIEKLKLFWQYPVITEKTFFQQNKHNYNYFAIPWATILDKRYNLNVIAKLLTPFKIITPSAKVYSCCQHISFRRLIPLFKYLGIQVVYTPHKIIGEDNIQGVEIIACPLYAVNIEDESRNKEYKNVNLTKIERPYLLSFIGGYQERDYLTNIRKRIFDIGKTWEKNNIKDVVIINTGEWHFNKDVYGGKQNANGELMEDDHHKKNTSKYNEYMLKSIFSLCPSGSGPNSIRLWESLGAGSIPIVLADTLDLPKHELMEKSVIRVKESDLDTLYERLKNISDEEIKERRVNCLKLYKHFKDNFINEKHKKNQHLNMVIFTNCHGEKYIEMFKRDSKIPDIFNINYIVSYQQLNNFNNYKHLFEIADVLIINNIKNYNDFTLTNLKKILKKDVLLIVLPFVRFNGYWYPEKFKRLKYFMDNSVSYFPNIELENINNYLNEKVNNYQYEKYYNACLSKLKMIENESDIKFYDFFIKNHLEYPMFRDNYHPTKNILEYIGIEIMKKIQTKYNIEYNEKKLNLVKDIMEYGHYKPIKNDIKKKLNIKYDLDKVFIWSRKEYLYKILNYEKYGNKKIKDLDEMKLKLGK